MAEPWYERAECRDSDPEIFTPQRMRSGPKGKRVVDRDWSKARAVCGRCPVLTECLADALDAELPGDAGGAHFLFQAGRTPEELMELRRLGWTGRKILTGVKR